MIEVNDILMFRGNGPRRGENVVVTKVFNNEAQVKLKVIVTGQATYDERPIGFMETRYVDDYFNKKYHYVCTVKDRLLQEIHEVDDRISLRDIPHPDCPEYRELHDKIQASLSDVRLLERKIKELL
jgi:hypothetical protein